MGTLTIHFLMVFGGVDTSYGNSQSFHSFSFQVQQGGSSLVEEPLDPFSLVADELSLIGNRLREMVVAEVPELASAAEYFFKMGVEGKRFRPTVLLLMASALNVSLPGSVPDAVANFSNELRTRQQCIAEITEMIHVASLLHDDVLNDADTRRGVRSLNFLMGNKNWVTF
ncbi:solanesyl-diphosphate synthase 1, mitochondrial-like [Papaver somniferum]|uniref:solanesyl-diphosphate synthase 1, mitochondrial-like n=1 Tax=Papaver somniferum TaxID=3469 RepID=UPI000E6FDAE7|nr:solanesyl-diphosphate synthase 1, mitochondrial-like [Papaver somniferum]